MSAVTKRKIRAAIKQYLEPHLAAEGFIGKYPHFRRPEAGHLHLLSIIHDKWGGGFVLEFAPHPAGPMETSWGATVLEEALEIGYVDPAQRARLVQSKDSANCYENFFRYDELGEEKEACERLIVSIVALFPQINCWLRNKEVGPNIISFTPDSTF